MFEADTAIRFLAKNFQQTDEQWSQIGSSSRRQQGFEEASSLTITPWKRLIEHIPHLRFGR